MMEQVSESVYVDTCFLMAKEGRAYLETAGLCGKVIAAVRRELETLASCHSEAREACAFVEAAPAHLELLPRLPEERDIEKTLPAGEQVTADAVFRRLAIQNEACGREVRFLTADTALARVLSLYRGVSITFWSRSEKRLVDWPTYSQENIRRAQQELPRWMQGRDVVLTASVLNSPYMRQFLLNISASGVSASDLPLLHHISIETATEVGHLTREMLALLAHSRLVRYASCEADYASESALMDALYFARNAGRPVAVLVGDWAMADSYDACSRAAELLPDSVCFYNLNVWGEPMQLHKDWRLLKRTDRLHPIDPLALGGAVAPVPDVDSKITQLIQKENTAELEPLIGSSAELLAKAILMARRWGRREVFRALMQKVDCLPPACLCAWFREHKNNPARLTQEALLEDDEYYQALRVVIAHTADVLPAVNTVAILTHLARQGVGLSAQRARVVLGDLRQRGVAIPAKDVEPVNLFAPKHLSAIVKQHQNSLVDIIKTAKMAQIPQLVAQVGLPEQLPALKALAIKLARRQNRPGVVALLLKDWPELPPYCFEHWFSHSASYAESPRAHDLLLRKSFFDLTKRIIRQSAHLQNCTASMQTLRNLSRSDNPLIQQRALALLHLATEKGAPVVK